MNYYDLCKIVLVTDKTHNIVWRRRFMTDRMYFILTKCYFLPSSCLKITLLIEFRLMSKGLHLSPSHLFVIISSKLWVNVLADPCNPLNHLAYADDTVIFTSVDTESLKSVMIILRRYEQTSGQLINKEKNSYYMHTTVANSLSQTASGITGFTKN